MKYFTVPMLVGFALAGCTSSDQSVIDSAVPVASTAPAPVLTPSAPPARGTPLNQGSTNTAPVPEATRMAGFPPPPARLEKCRTVGSVTTCDVPPDPTADNRHYTN